MRSPRMWPLLLALVLAGCGETPWSGLRASLSPPAALPAIGVPEGPALRLTLGGRASHAALLQELGERRLWRTDSGFVVATDGARVVATSGLAEVLAATRFEGPDPLAHPAALLGRGAAARRLVDLMRADRDPKGMRFGVEIECRLRAFPTAEAGLLLVEERCRGGGRGGFTNRFWVEEEGGAVLRSEQWIGPGLPPLVLEPLGIAS
ncbi:YjbF family lipoprotein [Crenalkalicoccus roseus]|uniref:YjbF family lipoprotein n=1 Tax=Crenalkalicoccus roseus TaxID=1485588 RepID=UPI001080091B|nr:YjbF family lipoprotein [Crenalkalicoccus roseus]